MMAVDRLENRPAAVQLMGTDSPGNLRGLCAACTSPRAVVDRSRGRQQATTVGSLEIPFTVEVTVSPLVTRVPAPVAILKVSNEPVPSAPTVIGPLKKGLESAITAS